MYIYIYIYTHTYVYIYIYIYTLYNNNNNNNSNCSLRPGQEFVHPSGKGCSENSEVFYEIIVGRNDSQIPIYIYIYMYRYIYIYMYTHREIYRERGRDYSLRPGQASQGGEVVDRTGVLGGCWLYHIILHYIKSITV